MQQVKQIPLTKQNQYLLNNSTKDTGHMTYSHYMYNRMYLYSTKMAHGNKPQLHKLVPNQEVTCVEQQLAKCLEPTNGIYASQECQIRNMSRDGTEVQQLAKQATTRPKKTVSWATDVYVTIDAESAYILATQENAVLPTYTNIYNPYSTRCTCSSSTTRSATGYNRRRQPESVQ